VRTRQRLLFVSLSLLGLFSACSQPGQAPAAPTGKLNVVATTTIIGDVVHQVGGEALELSVLLPPGVDPHSFEPSPRDVARIADADIIFANGAGLEAFLDSLLVSAGAKERVVHLSDELQLIDTSAPAGAHASDTDAHREAQPAGDPHVWTDPNNVMVWVDTIVRQLSALAPAHAPAFAANAEAYRIELAELDAWIREQVALVPESNRKLVTDHAVFGYFAARYGFTQVGALIPSYSTGAEPSAQELAALEDMIHAQNVPAIFVGQTVNPNLAARVAQDTGTQLVYLYTGSLSEADGPAASYLDYIRYNVRAITEALKS